MFIELSELRGWADAVRRAPEQLDREMITSTRVALRQGVTYTVEGAPHKDGILRASIKILSGPSKSGNAYIGTYGTRLEYAAQREYGGTIVPRRAKFLVFEIDGQLVFAKSVTQTGSFYMEKSAERLQNTVTRMYEAGVSRALRSIGAE